MSKWARIAHLDIYVPIVFQWYKEFLKPLNFDPSNCPLKIWESTETPIPKVKVSLGVWGFIPSHFSHSRVKVMWLPGFPLGPQPCKPFVLVANPRLRLRHNYCDNFKYQNFQQFYNNLTIWCIIVNEIWRITSITYNINNATWKMHTSFSLSLF